MISFKVKNFSVKKSLVIGWIDGCWMLEVGNISSGCKRSFQGLLRAIKKDQRIPKERRKKEYLKKKERNKTEEMN